MEEGRGGEKRKGGWKGWWKGGRKGGKEGGTGESSEGGWLGGREGGRREIERGRGGKEQRQDVLVRGRETGAIVSQRCPCYVVKLSCNASAKPLLRIPLL